MGESLPKMTRSLASDMMDLEQVSEVNNHDSSAGKVSFSVNESLSSRRLDNLLPEGWRTTLIVGESEYTMAYITDR